MILKWIELENIRSYARERIEFPLGTTLLSGDVGCGKSSVLLAAEFALFGIQRGEVSGSDLLRHGEKEGGVRLCFEVDGKNVVIGRSLRRDSNGVSQESGFIEINGMRQSKTATELRAAVLDLLGYPLEYQKKNPIVFRYTVYTPQDEMKRILRAQADERLNILRKIFQIDKYGRIRTNADIAIRELRAMKRECDSLSSDLEQRIDEAEEKRKQLETLGEELKRHQSAFVAVSHELEEKARELESISERIRSLAKKAQLAAAKEAAVRQLKMRNQSAERELLEIARGIETIEKSLGAKPAAPPFSKSEVFEKKRKLAAAQRESVSLQSQLSSEIARYKNILEKGMCAVCGQAVEDRVAFAEKISQKEAALEAAKSDDAALARETAQLEQIEREINEYEHKIKLYANSERELQEKKKRSLLLTEEISRNSAEISSMEAELSVLRPELGEMPRLESEERRAKADFSSIQARKNDVERALARIDSQIEAYTRELNRIEKDIALKRRMRERSARLTAEISWFDQTFVPLVQTIEQAVMSTIQQAFNHVFQSWFSMLMGNENLGVEADDQFAPVITQEGYRTEYQNLSGGEKTAVALAYRLALNKAINTLIESMRTKDLIILDEPTDGFSSEQIDRIRDVLSELNLKQMIIVSHEPKIDTFVEHVIRFHKEGNVSRVVK